ncbi:MAG: tetratricopeptide repeat protein [Bacteroides sp.]|nr:tetratricopeptide repeat protein [Bacteroides sp.]MCM1550452.1 tetratricopeptide repeat protein [Clostridium sp.]
MEEALVWKILGLEPTKDETQLKNQYHELLRTVNPEDDAEGFKRLREAYETAMELIRVPDNTGEPEEKPKDEIDIWLDRVNNIYWYKDTRNNPELWQELFNDPICVALDTALEVRERFLVYLMNHNYLKQEVWQRIDKEFSICADIKELEEMFPRDFLDYVRYQIENQTFFTYEHLKVTGIDESEVQLDTYIASYLRIKAKLDREEYEGLWQQLEDLAAFEVYHPYEDVERIRLYLQEQKAEAALALGKKLLEEYPDDVYIGYWAGKAYWGAEEWEEAYQCWQHVADCMPDHYSVRVEVARYYMKKQENLKAKELIMDLLEINGRDDSVLDLMREVNIPLIDYYHELAEQEPENKKHAIEACWCMFQNEMFTETIEELDKLELQPAEAEYYDYVNMKGRCFLGLERYTEAIEYLLKWDECRKNLPDDGSDKYKKRQSREGFIKSAIGVAYQNVKDFSHAEQYLKEGIQLEKDEWVRHSFMDRLALLYYDNGKYERCVDICSAIIEEDMGYYPAYLRRQEAYFEMQNGQCVVDDYYNAIRIFPKFYKPYLLAVRVFCIYRQYEDAKKVIEAAKEQGIHQELLQFYEIRVLRNLAHTEEENRKVMNLCQQLKKELQEAELAEKKVNPDEGAMTEAELLEQDMRKDGMPQDKVDKKDLAFEEILICMDMDQLDQALQLIQAELQKGNTDYRLRWVKADIHRMKQEYETALSEYTQLEQEMPDHADVTYQKGICLKKLRNTEGAIQAFRSVLEKDAKHSRVNHELMTIYSRRFDNYELKSAYGAALKYINAQLELVPDAYYYIERGLLYMDNFNMDLAVADYEKALELEPDNVYAYNNIGYVLQSKGRFEEAIAYFKQSIAHMTDEKTLLPYRNMASCYKALRQWDKGIEILEKARELAPSSSSVYYSLGNMYACKGDMIHARQIFDEALEKKLIRAYSYYEDVINNVFLLSGDMQSAKNMYNQWLNETKCPGETPRKTAEARVWVLEQMGCFYYYQRNLKQAIHHLEEAVKLAQKYEIDIDIAGRRLAVAYLLTGQQKKAKDMAAITMKALICANHVPAELKQQEAEDPETVSAYLSYRPLAPQRLDRMAQMYLCLGDEKHSLECLERIKDIPRCRSCSYAVCYDSMITRALLAEVQGNLSSAIRLYEQALVINPGDEEVVLTLDALRRKSGAGK